jgi:hypothetical protein
MKNSHLIWFLLGCGIFMLLIPTIRNMAGCESPEQATIREHTRQQNLQRELNQSAKELDGSLLERVQLTGVRKVGTDGYVGFANGTRYVISEAPVDGESCSVLSVADADEIANTMRKEGTPLNAADPILTDSKKAIFLVHHSKTGWELMQGDESCFVNVSH